MIPALFGFALAVTSCSTTPRYRWTSGAEEIKAEAAPLGASLSSYRGKDARQVAWVEVLAAAEWADVVLIGEQHDDATAHALQKEFLEEVLRREPQTTLSLEFLERDEQPVIDQYLAGEISREDFISKTQTGTTGGTKSWEDWYQPLVDTAKDAGTRVIGANPPRKYARQARTEGLDALRALPAEEQQHFTLPTTTPSRSEWKLFRAQMEESAKAHGGSPSDVSDQMVESFLRAQELWNSTMAASILAELDRGAPKVVHVVGGFHIEKGGGIVRELRHNRPELRILTIQLDPELEQPVRKRADVITHTRKAGE